MKILIGVGVVILLLIILIVALPFLIDLNRYQDRYRPLIEKALNRNVELKDIRLTLWPRIGARIGTLIVQDDPTFRAGPFASLSSLDVGVKLLPLLTGKVDVEEITLRNPVITVLKNGQGAGAGNSQNSFGHGGWRYRHSHRQWSDGLGERQDRPRSCKGR